MTIRNLHERVLQAPPAGVGALIDSLASPRDALWPRRAWPRMAFDRPLAVGAVGGHGPVRYDVEAYEPGQRIRFRFTAPRGFHGYHEYSVHEGVAGGCLLRHVIMMTTRGIARLTWPWIFRPLHDALLEDSLARAQASLGQEPTVRPWSRWVRFLRWSLSGGRAASQVIPGRFDPGVSRRPA